MPEEETQKNTDALAPQKAKANTQVRALLARASLLKMRGMGKEAIATCQEALKIAPDSVATHAVMGDIYEGMGQYAEAVAAYQAVIERDPTRQTEREKRERLLKILTATQPSAAPVDFSSHAPSTLAPTATTPAEGASREGEIARLLYICSGVLGALVLLTGSYWLWQNKQKNTLPQPRAIIQSTPIAATPEPVVSPAATPVAATPRPATPAPTPVPNTSTLEKNLLLALPGNTRVLQITQDPKQQEILIRLVAAPRGSGETANQVQDRLLFLAATAIKTTLNLDTPPQVVRLWIDMAPFDPKEPVLRAEGNPEQFRHLLPAQTSREEIIATFVSVQWASKLVDEPLPATPLATTPEPAATPDMPPPIENNSNNSNATNATGQGQGQENTKNN
jgi:hypothetical protein